jgi:hypothetical protein
MISNGCPDRTQPSARPDGGDATGAMREGASHRADLKANAQGLAGSAATAAQARDFILTHGAAALKHLDIGLTKIASGLRSLSKQSAHGAAHLDPNALSRILDRMDSLGDATLRQIEGRIGATTGREDRKRLQVLRDEMRKWLDARDAHLADAQLAVDDIGDRAKALRAQLLERADQLAEAAEFVSSAARALEADAGKHLLPEAAGLSKSLRASLDEMRFC